MASTWFYKAMGEQVGPVSSAELRALAQRGTVQRDTLVATAADGPWVRAERVRGLFPVSRVEPPTPPAPPPVATTILVRAKPIDLPAMSEAKRTDGASIMGRSPVAASTPADENYALVVRNQRSLIVAPGTSLTTRAGRFSSKRNQRILVGGASLAGFAVVGVTVLLGVLVVARRAHPPSRSSNKGDLNRTQQQETEVQRSGGRATQTFAEGTPEYVVEQYLKGASWRERLRFVKRTEGIEDKMAKHYGGEFIKANVKSARRVDLVAPGGIVMVNAILSPHDQPDVKIEQRYYLELHFRRLNSEGK